ncbi:MAG: cupin domain-containing protein [Deltaproteobacteria bacterium]|nr:cupin domain-containing protein [Deltaproteobacteria bacterium]
MSADIDSLLAQYALGILPREQHTAVERYLASSDDAVHSLRELRDAAAMLGTETPSRGRPRAATRLAMLQLGCGPARFIPFVDRVATLFDVPSEDARDALALIDTAGVWKSLRPGVRFVDVEGGPALGDRHAGLVRMEPGVVFPRHRHQGDESFLIVHGAARDSQGLYMQPGDIINNRDGSEHSVTVVGDQELIYAIVLGSYTIIED